MFILFTDACTTPAHLLPLCIWVWCSQWNACSNHCKRHTTHLEYNMKHHTECHRCHIAYGNLILPCNSTADWRKRWMFNIWQEQIQRNCLLKYTHIWAHLLNETKPVQNWWGFIFFLIVSAVEYWHRPHSAEWYMIPFGVFCMAAFRPWLSSKRWWKR